MSHTYRLAVVSFVALATATVACAVEPQQEEASSGSEDALTQAECTPIVQKHLDESKADCAQKLADAEAKETKRAGLERAVTSAAAAFGEELSRYDGANASTIRGVVAECSAIGCSGELKSAGTTAECSVERAFLRGACYVRNLPEIRAAAGSLDFSDETARLEGAVDAMKQQWAGLVAGAAWLRTEHAACSKVAGSDAQRAALNSVCRASCDEDDATSVGKVNDGYGSACTPPNYQAVKDDFGNAVTCGSMRRALKTRFACECVVDNDRCTQFASLASSSEHGADCRLSSGAAGTQKIRWNAGAHVAELVCAR